MSVKSNEKHRYNFSSSIDNLIAKSIAGIFILFIIIGLGFNIYKSYVYPNSMKVVSLQEITEQDCEGSTVTTAGVKVELAGTIYKNYIKMSIQEGTTWKVEFLKDNKINSMVVNYYELSNHVDDENLYSVIQMIPDYIAKEGYDTIILRPLDSPRKYVIHDFELLSSDEITPEHYQTSTVFDFEIKQFEITISENDYKKLEVLRKEYLKTGYRIEHDDESLVDGKIKYQGEEYKTNIRFKGDAIIDHLGTDKWSFRFDLKGENCIEGMQKFSIQAIFTRGYTWESLIYDFYKYVGGASIRYTYVDVYVNGVYKGVYALEEAAEKRVIENNERREGPIVKMDDTIAFESGIFDPKTKGVMVDRNFKIFSQSKTAQSPVLSKYADYAIHSITAFLDGDDIDCFEIFDMDLYARLYAISDIICSRHGRLVYSTRHYFNPITGLLEPIPYDEGILHLDRYFTFSNDTPIYKISDLAYKFFADERFRELYQKYMDEYFELSNTFLEDYSQTMRKDWMTVKRDSDYSSYEFDPYDRIQTRMEIYSELKETIPEIDVFIFDNQIIVDNYGKVPVVISSIENSDGDIIDLGIEYPYWVLGNNRARKPTTITIEEGLLDAYSGQNFKVYYKGFLNENIYVEDVIIGDKNEDAS